MNPDLEPEDTTDSTELTAVLEAAGRLVWAGADMAHFVMTMREVIASFAPGMLASVDGERERRAIGGGLAYALWHAMPQRSLNWRCPPARLPGRNDPCLCGSGKKSKKCCGDTVPPVEAFSQMNMLRYVLDAVSKAQLSQVNALRMQAEAVAHTAHQWLEENQEDRVVALLAPLFDKPDKLDARHAEALEHLMSAWLVLGETDKRLHLLDSIENHDDRALAAVALQFRAMIAADHDQWDEAWQWFEAAKRKQLDEPALALLETTLLLGQGRDARPRAQWWAGRLTDISPEFEDLAAHLLALADEGALPGAQSPLGTGADPSGLTDALSEAMQSERFESLEQAQAFADSFMGQQNTRPVAEFGGLSPEQMHHLLNFPFDCEVVQFAQSVPGVSQTPVMRWYRALANGLADGGAKRTAKGNLPREMSKSIAQQVWTSEEYAREQRITRISSETDVRELHVTRLVAGLAGLIRAYKGRFVLTRLGQKLLSSENDGEVYALLLKAYALKFNWAYLDGYPPLRIVQQSFAFTLYLLWRHEREPERLDADYGRDFTTAFPAAVLEGRTTQWRTAEEEVRSAYELRALSGFAGFFGLIEARAQRRSVLEPQPVAVTPLIHEVAQFAVGGA